MVCREHVSLREQKVTGDVEGMRHHAGYRDCKQRGRSGLREWNGCQKAEPASVMRSYYRLCVCSHTPYKIQYKAK